MTLLLGLTVNAQSTYCNSSGNNTNYEYLDYIMVNGDFFQSGNNGGYYNGTNQTFQLNAGQNSIVLSPGYTGNAYYEKWAVWIDLNKDRVF